MSDYLILSWPRGNERCAAQAERISGVLSGPISGWIVMVDRPGCLAAVKRHRVRKVTFTSNEEGLVIGDVFRRDAPADQTCPASATDFDTLSRRLSSEHWGSYIAATAQPDGSLSLFRDPIGMMECITWFSDGIRLVASNPTPWLSIAPPRDCAIDWAAVGAILRDSSILPEVVPLIGLDPVPPGVITRFGCPDVERTRIWHPSDHYRAGGSRAGDAAQLREIVSRCVSAWIGAYPDCAVEISGGLDSGIVALAGNSHGRSIRFGINFFSDDLAGDERRFARDVARVACRPLREIFMPVGALGAADLEGMPVGPRPGIGSVTLFHDRLAAEIGTTAGATALLSGLGGDSVFFQHPTPLIAADPSFPRRSLAAIHALANWSSVSMWTVARDAWRCKSADDRPMHDDSCSALPIGVAASDYRSTWAGDVDDLPPAKRLQIKGIGGCRTALGLSWRGQAMAYIHPLLSQPIVEHAIGIDTYELTRGTRDRALAREAFADLLPRSLVERRGKGSLTHFFGQCLAASVPFIRDFLLDGRLATAGVLDREALAPMIDPEFLMQYDCYTKLISAIIVEHWARVWSDRLTPIVRVERSQTQASREICRTR